MSQARPVNAFGQRPRQHTLILASGDRVRHVTVTSWMAALAIGLFVLVTAGYFSATAYLIFRDELIGATLARQTRMQHAYEDRIASLRSQLDSVTSRQMLDQRLMANKVEQLAAEQAAISSRHGRLDDLLRRAEVLVPGATETPTPTPRPSARAGEEQRADAATALEAIELLTTGSTPSRAALSAGRGSTALGYAATRGDQVELTGRIIDEVSSSLSDMEREQIERLHLLASSADQRADRLETALLDAGLKLPPAQAGMGGPFIADTGLLNFDTSLDDLDHALLRLDALKTKASVMPLAHPAPGKMMTSRYGTRRDPFLRRTAFHAGVDFALAPGESVRATGSGTVIHAAPSGGYGKLVEIDHGDGVVTRYAHLQSIAVVKGQPVDRGDSVGGAGSTGRSTGTHLHYEVRSGGRPADPLRFINAGRLVEPILTE